MSRSSFTGTDEFSAKIREIDEGLRELLDKYTKYTERPLVPTAEDSYIGSEGTVMDRYTLKPRLPVSSLQMRTQPTTKRSTRSSLI